MHKLFPLVFIMNSQLKRLYTELENQRKYILDEVSRLPDDRYHRSVNGKWSVAHILTHLLTSEKLSLGYMKKKSLGIQQAKNSGAVEAIKSRLLNLSQRIPFLKYKAPKYVVDNTPKTLAYHELLMQWNDLRTELAAFLENMDEKNARKKIYKHPVAGRLDVIQAVSFFREHINHHLPQIKRLL